MNNRKADFVFREYSRHAVFAQYTGSEKVVVIPAVSPAGKPVTELGDNAFSYNKLMEIVVIPDTCSSIGCGCFDGASQLRYIGTHLPFNENNIISVLPKSVRRIDYRAFAETAIESIRLEAEDRLEVLEFAFSGCRCLKTVSLPHCKKIYVGDNAFLKSGINVFSAPHAVSYLAIYAFGYCSSLRELEIHAFGQIEDHAFYGCSKLAKISPKEYVPNTGLHSMTDKQRESAIF